VETEDTIDTSALANYGSVDVRRKKDDDEDGVYIDEDKMQAMQDEIDREREEKMREIAEKEMFQKEKQLVVRR